MWGVGTQSVLGFRALLNAKGAAGRPQGFPATHCTLGWAVMEPSEAEASIGRASREPSPSRKWHRGG